jgi:hypothetical protein
MSKKVGHNHRVWDTNCLEKQPADWFTWTGILMNAAVRMSNLLSLSYVVFAISGLCFSVVSYLSVCVLLTASFSCVNFQSL